MSDNAKRYLIFFIIELIFGNAILIVAFLCSPRALRTILDYLRKRRKKR